MTVGRGGLGEVVQDDALRSGSAGTRRIAGLHEGDEAFLKRLQLAHFGSNRGEVLGGHIAGVHARALGIVHDCHERVDLFDREIEVPAPPNECAARRGSWSSR
jgi:hypothetical protein